MSRKRIRYNFKLPWVRYPNSGKYEIWGIKIGPLVFDLEIEDQSKFYLIGEIGYNVKTIEEAEDVVLKSIKELVDKLKKEIVEYEKFLV